MQDEAEEYREYLECELCPRRCRVNRLAGQCGFCGQGAQLRIASIGAHFGEEPPLAGADGSGTVFFTGCPCGCFFCQNYQLSREHLGEALSVGEAVKRVLLLAQGAVRNINFVTPEHFWPHIRAMLRQLRAAGCQLPAVWNTSGYCRVELLAQQAEWIDIFLPDFKYADGALARRCMGCADYPEVALAALRFLVDRCGFLRPFDESGQMPASHGVLVRHLVLPGEVENSLSALRILHREFGSGLPVSVMRQFRPMPECFRRHDLERMVTDAEYGAVIAEVERLGFRRVFIQPDSGDPGFVPDFTHTARPFAGNPPSQSVQNKE